MKLYMGPREIEYEYTHAANKTKQINILAELNGTVPLVICHILYERNVLDIDNRTAQKYMALRMISEGRELSYISDKLNISNSIIDKAKKDYGKYMWIFGNNKSIKSNTVMRIINENIEKIREIQKNN